MNKTSPEVLMPDSRDTLDLHVRRVRLGSADTSYVDEGRGRPVVLLHGAPLTSLGFAPLIHGLRRHCRVLAPDLPGFGASTPRREGPWSLEDYARFAVEFVEALDLRDATIFVHDSSGPIGLAAAVRLRDRLGGLVVADTVPIPLSGWAALVGTVLRHVVTSRPARWINRRANALPWLVANVAPMHRRLPRRVRAAMTADFAVAHQRDRLMDLFRSLANEHEFLERTADLVRQEMTDMPALILYGQFDPMRFVGGFRRYRELLPRATTVVVPLEEHFPMLGSANAVADAITSWMSAAGAGRVEPVEEPLRG